VVIEHVKVASPAGGGRAAGLAALEREVHELQRPMVERLRELGAGASAEALHATATGIRAPVAARPWSSG
jgi:hypothetical protein